MSTSKSTTAGVLPISIITSAGAAQPNGAPHKDAATKPVSQRLKVVVRRLPPGLTPDEFDAVLGDEWQTGKGKVVWKSYKAGKISKDLSKPSRPARAYLQLAEQAHLDNLASKVREATFVDARKTDHDSVLIGPPVVEFAPYGRVPLGRRRNDVRQGLIDQDPEFIQFLESLTNPISKAPTVDGVEITPAAKDDTRKVTPLIQYLRDKKAAKEAAKDKDKDKDKDKNGTTKAAKHSRQGSKNDGVTAAAAPVASVPTKAKPGSNATADRKTARTAKPDKAPPAIKGKKDKEPSLSVTPTAAQPTQASPATQSQPPVVKRPDVPAGAAVARMLQRDLGLKAATGDKVARRTGNRGRSTSNAPVPPSNTAAEASQQSTAASTTNIGSPKPRPAQAVAPSPAILKRETAPAAPTKTTPQPTAQVTTSPAAQSVKSSAPRPSSSGNAASSKSSRNALSSPSATQAFLKHANPSQGISEALLEAAFAPFGTVVKVEMDKRKGFAYVEFSEPQGLQKAVAASPVKVAQGSVQVLERKERTATAAATAVPAPSAAPAPAPASVSRTGAGNNGGGAGRGAKQDVPRAGRGGTARRAPAKTTAVAAEQATPPGQAALTRPASSHEAAVSTITTVPATASATAPGAADGGGSGAAAASVPKGPRLRAPATAQASSASTSTVEPSKPAA